jgi:uncharacterized protein (UPF0303 family)
MDAKQILEQCAKEEELYQFLTFTQTDALALGTLIYQKSLNKESPVAIEIRMNRLTVFSFFPSGTNENNKLWLAAKARTVDMNQQSSLRFWAEIQVSGRRPEDRRMPESEYACCGGGFPLTIKNCGVVGTICVSGLPHLLDHALVVEALKAYLQV